MSLCVYIKSWQYSGLVANACHPSTWEAEAAGKRVQGQPELHREFSASLCNLVTIILIKRLSAKPQRFFFIAIPLSDTPNSSKLKHPLLKEGGAQALGTYKT